MNLKSLIGAAAIAVALPLASQAAPISVNSQLDLVGEVFAADFRPGGFVNFHPTLAVAAMDVGDFDPFVNTIFEAGADTIFTMVDINFDALGLIYFNEDISFTATNIISFDNVTDPVAGFKAAGIITLAGFDPTPGFFSLSVQDKKVEVSFSSTTTPIPLPASVLMLLAALGGLGVVSRRGSATA